MTVYLVGAGPGDPGLLTRRGEALLATADVVVYDRLVDPALLSLARPGATLVDVGKQPSPAGSGIAGDAPGTGRGTADGDSDAVGGGGRRQADINALLVELGQGGRTVVRLKGGDPFVFGRGGEEAEALQAAGVAWEVVPGVTSAFAVPAYAGVPVTHRGLSTSVTVVTGHVGDPSAPGGVDWTSLGRAGGTLVVLMGMATREEIGRRLLAAGRPASTPVLVCQWGTLPWQRSARTTLGELGGVGLGSPAVIVVGDVAGLDLPWVTDRPLAGRSIVVTRPRDRKGALAAALMAAGARVIELPVVEFRDPDDGGTALRAAAATVATYGWVVFTSAAAVDRVVPLWRDARDLRGANLAAVGRGTADALAGYHLVADLVPGPERSTGAGLAAAFPAAPERLDQSRRVLFPKAAGARPTVPEGLRAKGWEVDEVVAYRTVPTGPPPEEVVAGLAHTDAVTFASPSAVDAYLSITTAAGHRLPVPPVVACIGPTTAAAARARGLDVAVVPASPSVEGLVGALAHAVATLKLDR